MARLYYSPVIANGSVSYQVYFEKSDQVDRFEIPLWKFIESKNALLAIKDPIAALNTWGLPSPMDGKTFDEIIKQWKSSQPSVPSGPAQCSKCGMKNEYLTGPYICTGCKLWESVT